MKVIQVRKEIFEDKDPDLEKISERPDKPGKGHHINTFLNIIFTFIKDQSIPKRTLITT
jgi:hypothetical protein